MRSRSRMVVVPLLVLTLLVAFAAPGAQVARAQTEERCFAETGQCISGPIRVFWE